MTERPSDAALAWHIDKTNGLGEVIVAHACLIMHSGVLAFHRIAKSTGDLVLVRALSPREWHDVQLVDTPVEASAKRS